MIEISPQIKINENEIHYEYIRASGPGGQNVNKVSTAVQLRFDIHQSTSLPPDVKSRLVENARNRISEDGILIIEAKRYRTQEQNREDALNRFIMLVEKALQKPKTRRATRPGISAKNARLFAKKRRAEVKRTRKYNPADWDG